MLDTVSYIKENLRNVYSDTEINYLIGLIMEYTTGKPFSMIIPDKSKKITTKEEQIIENIVFRLKSSEPIQYILGETEFYGLRFNVNKNVLIPRPETEELVELIVNENRQENLRILDIGTGSGVIAVSLQKKMKSSIVTGWDISEEVIRVAKENAAKNNADVTFQQVDVLGDYPQDQQFDIIVSNPPYVLDSEKDSMQDNVLDYEPHTALFVPDNSALIFYERIADIAQVILKDGGKLYFEINPLKSDELTAMLIKKVFHQIELVKDISGKQRMAKARKA